MYGRLYLVKQSDAARMDYLTTAYHEMSIVPPGYIEAALSCYIDRLGRGFPMIFREMEKLGKTVEVVEFGEELRVIISR